MILNQTQQVLYSNTVFKVKHMFVARTASNNLACQW